MRTSLRSAAGAAALVLAACGGGGGGGGGDDGSPGAAAADVVVDPDDVRPESEPVAESPDPTSGTEPPPALEETGPPSVANVDNIPDVVVRDVTNGGQVNLRELAAGQDTLFWFWAPH